MNVSVHDALATLVREAGERLSRSQDGKTVVTVQVSHCSISVGAGKVAEALTVALPDDASMVTAGCDGACFDAPQVLVTTVSGKRHRYVRVSPDSAREIAAQATSGCLSESTPTNGFHSGQRRITLEGCGEIDCEGIDSYLDRGGYSGLARALAMSAEELIEEVTASGLRGRGGAYFPAALKWQGARSVNVEPRYLVVNSEEGEPGVFKDRHLMEGVPHRLLEGAIIAAYASGVERAYIYINAEANLSADRMQRAVEQAYEKRLLGEDILSSGYTLEAEIMRGAGGYVCGEETTLLNTMEGYRREPRLRPPFPTEHGLWAKPTVINNAETLCSLPYILSNGAKAYAEVGSDDATGTKIISLSGSVRRPGVAEVAMGTTLRQIIHDIGGGLPEGRELAAVAVGGPSSGIFPPSEIETPIKPGFLHDSGVMLGAGGIIVLDKRTSVLDSIRALAEYNANESCGKCTPCREGTPRMVAYLDKVVAGQSIDRDVAELKELAEVVNAASLCGLGQAAGNPILSALHFFGDEFSSQ